ncbi:MAG: hypothetical protein CBC73_02165 [Flavobacteriales bacterium TMED113]|nr:MAG: hypothetical protein CBC73_02165 [Flavobacteriales bacterium TMED113]
MKKILLSIILFALCAPKVKADEGMWLPIFIERLQNVDLEKMGLKLSPEEIYSVNNSSLKDAIVSFNGYCTGEVISKNGLLLTNHHCGFDAIQNHSTVENDLLENGFWAQNMSEELSNPGFYVDFLVKIEDVTSSIIDETVIGASDLNSRNEAIRNNITKIKTSQDLSGTEWVEVKSFFGGNEYYLFIYERFNDVRMVGAPPSSIGKYGGDTDNWMWPRHTGDFALFRVYMSPDGSGSEYSEENIPLKPKHHLPISLNGVEKEDFTMVFGYPGGTQRYLSSFGVKQALEKYNPTFVEIRTDVLDVLNKYMSEDAEIKIKYASKKARVSNYWKYFIGQSKGLKALDVYGKKVRQEQAFTDYVNSTEKNIELYGNVLSDMESAYKMLDEIVIPQVAIFEGGWRAADAISFSRSADPLVKALESEDGEAIEAAIVSLREKANEFFKEYDQEVDQKLFAAGMSAYYSISPKEYVPEVISGAMEKYKCSPKWAKKTYKKSIFVNKERLMSFLESPSVKKIKNDPIYKVQSGILDFYFNVLSPINNEAESKLMNAERLLIKALREMYPDGDFYSDANFTMRMTYGTVNSYIAADAVTYDYYTTLEGVMAKMDNTNPEFVVPEMLVSLYESKDYGNYANEDGELPVCFISNNDITGGNSGSPVLNGYGHLVGCAFDGNWEAMSGDIAFEPELQRCISVDARYILFIIDKFAGATHIIDELTLIDSSWYEEQEIAQALENEMIDSLVNDDNEKKEALIDENMSFQDAFLMHWRNGDKSFTWNNVIYTTEREDKRTIQEAR